MDIRRAILKDREVLLDVWLRSVRATHAFVPEVDIQSMIPQVRDYLASSEPEFWVLCDDSEAVWGFVGMSGRKMESLFLARSSSAVAPVGGWSRMPKRCTAS